LRKAPDAAQVARPFVVHIARHGIGQGSLAKDHNAPLHEIEIQSPEQNHAQRKNRRKENSDRHGQDADVPAERLVRDEIHTSHDANDGEQHHLRAKDETLREHAKIQIGIAVVEAGGGNDHQERAGDYEGFPNLKIDEVIEVASLASTDEA
jgi:hypothetical protein